MARLQREQEVAGERPYIEEVRGASERARIENEIGALELRAQPIREIVQSMERTHPGVCRRAKSKPNTSYAKNLAKLAPIEEAIRVKRAQLATL